MAVLHRRPTQVVEDRDVAVVEDRPLVTGIIGQALTLVAAAGLLLAGLITFLHTGVPDALDAPIVSSFGFTHTPLLGGLELLAGIVLLVVGLSERDRPVAAGVGIALIVAGLLVRFSYSSMPAELALERSYGGFLLVIGILATVGGLLPGGWARRYRRA